MNQEQIRNEFNNKIRNNFIQTHNLCQYCGKEAKHIHHLIPISKGGDNRESNLILYSSSTQWSLSLRNLKLSTVV